MSSFSPEKITETTTPNSMQPSAQDSHSTPIPATQFQPQFRPQQQPKPQPKSQPQQPQQIPQSQPSQLQEQTDQPKNPIQKRSSNFTITLPKTWKFWLIIVSNSTYQIEEIFSFCLLDFFYQYYHALPKMSELHCTNRKQISIALFEESIKPAWEDEMNQGGGYYSFMIYDRNAIDIIWKRLLLRLIGHSLIPSDLADKLTINGLLIRVRPNNVFEIQIWIRNSPMISPEIHPKFIEAVKNDIKEVSDYNFPNNRSEQQFPPIYRRHDRGKK